MVSISGIIGEMGKILQAFVPVGVDPIYFFATFLIAFSLIFILLNLIKFFKDSRGLSFLVAAIMAYFAASSAFVTIIISKLFPNIGLALMAILGLLLVIAFVSPGSFKGGGIKGAPVIALIAFLIVMWLTYSFAAPELARTGLISEGLGTTITDEDASIIIAAIIVIGVIMAIVSGKKQEHPFREWMFGPGW